MQSMPLSVPFLLYISYNWGNSVSATKREIPAEKSLQYRIKWHVPRVRVLTFFRVDLLLS